MSRGGNCAGAAHGAGALPPPGARGRASTEFREEGTVLELLTGLERCRRREPADGPQQRDVAGCPLAAGDDGRVLDGGPEPMYAGDTFCWAHLLIAKTLPATVSLQPPFHCQTGEAVLSLQRPFRWDGGASHPFGHFHRKYECSRHPRFLNRQDGGDPSFQSMQKHGQPQFHCSRPFTTKMKPAALTS